MGIPEWHEISYRSEAYLELQEAHHSGSPALPDSGIAVRGTLSIPEASPLFRPHSSVPQRQHVSQPRQSQQTGQWPLSPGEIVAEMALICDVTLRGHA